MGTPVFKICGENVDVDAAIAAALAAQVPAGSSVLASGRAFGAVNNCTITNTGLGVYEVTILSGAPAVGQIAAVATIQVASGDLLPNDARIGIFSPVTSAGPFIVRTFTTANAPATMGFTIVFYAIP
jgi:hypothetical protein